MKRILLIVFLAISFTSFSQGNWTLSGAKNRWANGIGFGQKDTSAYTNASDTNLVIWQYPNKLVYRHLLTDKWQIVSAGVGAFLPISDTAAMLSNKAGIVNTISQLVNYSGSARVVNVSDTLRGGLFTYISSGLGADSGTVFNSVLGGYWKRQFNQSQGYNVKWFGAKGDGTTDDTQAIQWAVNAAQQGQMIFFPQTNYLVNNTFYKVTSTITIAKRDLTFQSYTNNIAYGTVIKGVGSNFSIFTLNGANEVAFIGLSFFGNGVFNSNPDGSYYLSGANINAIKLIGDANANLDATMYHCSFSYLDTAVISKGRNVNYYDDLIQVCNNGIVILPATTGQNRGHVIQRTRFHTVGAAFNSTYACIKSTDAALFDIQISNNYFDGAGNALNIDLLGSGTVQVNDNVSTLYRSGLLKLKGFDKGGISGNVLKGNTTNKIINSGITLDSCKHINVTGNTLTNIGENGILLKNYSKYNDVQSNQIYNFGDTNTYTAGTYYAVKAVNSDSCKYNSIGSNRGYSDDNSASTYFTDLSSNNIFFGNTSQYRTTATNPGEFTTNMSYTGTGLTAYNASNPTNIILNSDYSQDGNYNIRSDNSNRWKIYRKGYSNNLKVFSFGTGGGGSDVAAWNYISGNMSVGDTLDNGKKLQVYGSGYYSGDLGVGTTTPNKVGASRSFEVNGSSDANIELSIADVLKAYFYHNGTSLTIANATGNGIILDGSIISLKHLKGNSSSPSIAAGAGAGTTPTVSINGTDLSGEITVTTGTSPSSVSVLCTITFATSFTSAPFIVFSPANQLTAQLVANSGIYVNSGTSSFTLNTNSVALSAGSTFKWNYTVIQ